MIRSAHRTVVARLLAVCLVALAASPLTAPFSVVDAGDFQQSQPLDAHHHHPAHDMAEAHVKVAPQIVITAPAVMLAQTAVARDPRADVVRLRPLATTPHARRAVLRL